MRPPLGSPAAAAGKPPRAAAAAMAEYAVGRTTGVAEYADPPPQDWRSLPPRAPAASTPPGSLVNHRSCDVCRGELRRSLTARCILFE